MQANLTPTPPQAKITSTNKDRLLAYWYRLLTKTQYTKSELIKKAKSKKYSESDIKLGIDQLQATGFIRDELVAEGISFRYKGNKGKRALNIQLLKKGVSKDLQQETLSQFQEEISQALLAQIKRKYGQIEDLYVRKDKILRFLAARGYTQPYSIYQSIEKEI